MRRFSHLFLLIALSAALAACGGGGSGSNAKLATSDIAIVGNTHITTTQFTAMMASAESSYKQQNQPFPKAGTSQYQSIKSQAVTLLVQRAERSDQANALGVVVTAQDVDKRVAKIKQQFFKGNEKQYQAELKKAKLTDATFRADLKQQMIEEKLYASLTKGLTIPKAQIAAYYAQHISDYTQKASRDVEYMLIKKKVLAYQLYTQLKANPAQFCADAKKFSGDPSTAKTCGKATFTKGETVGAFDTALFAAKTGVIHAPVYDATRYKAYFLILPTAAVKPGHASSLKSESASIKQTLLQTAKTAAINTWSTKIQKQFCSGSKIKYQVGYAPQPDPCTTLTTSTNTTTT